MDINFFEIALIVLVAFIVFGPEKLPDLAKKMGKCVRKVKDMWQSFSRGFE